MGIQLDVEMTVGRLVSKLAPQLEDQRPALTPSAVQVFRRSELRAVFVGWRRPDVQVIA